MANELSKLLEIRDAHDGLTYCVHTNGSIATHFDASHIDAELVELSEAQFQLTQAFKDLSPEVKVRFRSMSVRSSGPVFPHARLDAIRETGSIENKLYLTIEVAKPKAISLLYKVLRSRMHSQNAIDGVIADFSSHLRTKVFERLLGAHPLSNHEGSSLKDCGECDRSLPYWI